MDVFVLLCRYVLGKTKTEDSKHMYYLKRFIVGVLKCESSRMASVRYRDCMTCRYVIVVGEFDSHHKWGPCRTRASLQLH